jgi:plasmid maintenance system killer protein
LQLSFADREMVGLCSSRRALTARFGAVLARKIACRLAVLSAARSLEDLPEAPPIGLMRHDVDGLCSVTLAPDLRLWFQASVPLASNQVKNIIILDIAGSAPGPAQPEAPT